jgi:methylmalonyl-CoA/ethylmalonyl-CoA epimerase
MLTQIDHVGIACRNLEEKIELYCSTFGLTVASREVNGEQGVREAMLLVATAGPETGGAPDLRAVAGAGGAPPATDLRAAGAASPAAGAGPAGWTGTGAWPAIASYIQLLEPLRPDSPVGKFLERRGEGIHHVGYGVTDVRAALAEIGATGIRLVDERPRHGSMGASIAFLHPADLGGVLTELVEHPLDDFRAGSG